MMMTTTTELVIVGTLSMSEKRQIDTLTRYQSVFAGGPRGAMAKAMDCGIAQWWFSKQYFWIYSLYFSNTGGPAKIRNSSLPFYFAHRAFYQRQKNKVKHKQPRSELEPCLPSPLSLLITFMILVCSAFFHHLKIITLKRHWIEKVLLINGLRKSTVL